MEQTNRSRWQIYLYDLKDKGITRFVLDRIKKRKLTRKIFYMFRKPYVMIGKNKLYVNKMDTVVSETLMNGGVWEPSLTDVFKRYAKNSKLVIDVGANIGYYTLIASKVLGKKGTVYSFEPASVNFNLMARTVKENKLKNVVIENKALGDKNGTEYLYLNQENYGDNRIYAGTDNRQKEPVEVVTLDNYFFDTKTAIDLLKIDIQGYELKVMKGAAKLLEKRRIKAIITEFWPEGIKMAGDTGEEYIKFLKSYGFDLSQIKEKTGDNEINILAVLK